MADNKKYYYLKLKDNFFDSDEMIVLESMPDGYIYSNILLKLYLRSLKSQGRLMFNERIPFNSTMLGQVTRHSVGDVEKAIGIFRDLNLVDVLDNGAIYMTDIQSFIGKSSTEADRKRDYRQRMDRERQNLLLERQMSDKCLDKTIPELDIEKDINIDINNSRTEDNEKIPYSEIIDYLNEKANKNFKVIQKHKDFIKARWHEGQRLDDFKQVIDNMVANWTGQNFNGKPAETYLQPSTLFGNKFDQYLNQTPKKMNSLASDYDDLGF